MSSHIRGIDAMHGACTVVGDDTGGGFWGSLIKGAGEAAGRGVDYYQQQQAADAKKQQDAADKAKSDADMNQRATAAIAADLAATAATTQVLASADDLKNADPKNADAYAATSAKAAADQAAAQQASIVQDAAAVGLMGDGATRRLKAATDAVTAAVGNAQSAAAAYASAPKDASKRAAARFAQFRVQAAQMTAAKAANAQLTQGQKMPTPDEQAKADAIVKQAQQQSQGSFLTRKMGGVPVWGWGLGGVGVLGVVALIAGRR